MGFFGTIVSVIEIEENNWYVQDCFFSLRVQEFFLLGIVKDSFTWHRQSHRVRANE